MAPTTAAMTPPATETKPTFLFDDCCPLCRGYTATFKGLGWADRAPFSQVDDDTVGHLDFDRARHQIPLVDAATGDVAYGLDGILGIVTAEAPVLGRVANTRPVRWLLDLFYETVTYNRRHIVTAAPPLDGVDCAPDFNPARVRDYIVLCAVVGTGLAAAAGAVPAVLAATAIGAGVVLNRTDGWRINGYQAAGHIGSTALAAAIGAAVVAAFGAPTVAVGATAVAIGARKTWLRRWMLTTPTRG